MDPRHPNIAFAANTGALIAFVSLLFSAFLPIGTPRGWSSAETILAILILVFSALSWWAKLEHDTPVVHEHGTSAAQYEAMEDLPTMVSSMNSGRNVNSNTAAVIESIVGRQTSQEASIVSSAIGTLSSGEIGKSSAQAVSQNTVNHAVVNTENFDSRGFQTSGATNVPLPVPTQVEQPTLPAMLDLPEMPDLDDLIQSEKDTTPAVDLPKLPDFWTNSEHSHHSRYRLCSNKTKFQLGKEQKYWPCPCICPKVEYDSKTRRCRGTWSGSSSPFRVPETP